MPDSGGGFGADNFAELAQDGYTILRDLVPAEAIATFEDHIAALVTRQATTLGLSFARGDPFIDLFSVGGSYAGRLYTLMERMQILHEMTNAIGSSLRREGFFEHFGMEVPLVWPDIRADLPFGDTILPVHQDYNSTHCRTAFRMWVPLRHADALSGTICLYRGSHVLGPVAHDARDRGKPAIAGDIHDRFETVVIELPPGDGLLIDPLLLHASIPNASERTKFTLMVQIQDLATMIDPEDPEYHPFRLARAERSRTSAAS